MNMKKISGSTLYYKKIFPIIWFGFLAAFFAIDLVSGYELKSGTYLLIPAVLAVFSYSLFKKIFWSLVDEVYDDGDSLLFKKGKNEQRVDLKDIVNIVHTRMSSPERVAIKTNNDGPIGKDLTFILPFRFNPFSKNPTVTELIDRIDSARNN